jgi:hypothetical protein
VSFAETRAQSAGMARREKYMLGSRTFSNQIFGLEEVIEKL